MKVRSIDDPAPTYRGAPHFRERATIWQKLSDRFRDCYPRTAAKRRAPSAPASANSPISPASGAGLAVRGNSWRADVDSCAMPLVPTARLSDCVRASAVTLSRGGSRKPVNDPAAAVGCEGAGALRSVESSALAAVSVSTLASRCHSVT